MNETETRGEEGYKKPKNFRARKRDTKEKTRHQWRNRNASARGPRSAAAPPHCTPSLSLTISYVLSESTINCLARVAVSVTWVPAQTQPDTSELINTLLTRFRYREWCLYVILARKTVVDYAYVFL